MQESFIQWLKHVGFLIQEIVMILLIFQQNSGDVDDYRNAVSMLPENLSEAEREGMKAMIFQQGDIHIYAGGEVPSLLFKKTLDKS